MRQKRRRPLTNTTETKNHLCWYSTRKLWFTAYTAYDNKATISSSSLIFCHISKCIYVQATPPNTTACDSKQCFKSRNLKWRFSTCLLTVHSRSKWTTTFYELNNTTHLTVNNNLPCHLANKSTNCSHIQKANCWTQKELEKVQPRLNSCLDRFGHYWLHCLCTNNLDRCLV